MTSFAWDFEATSHLGVLLRRATTAMETLPYSLATMFSGRRRATVGSDTSRCSREVRKLRHSCIRRRRDRSHLSTPLRLGLRRQDLPTRVVLCTFQRTTIASQSRGEV